MMNIFHSSKDILYVALHSYFTINNNHFCILYTGLLNNQYRIHHIELLSYVISTGLLLSCILWHILCILALNHILCSEPQYILDKLFHLDRINRLSTIKDTHIQHTYICSINYTNKNIHSLNISDLSQNSI